jgi:hypothetical protein
MSAWRSMRAPNNALQAYFDWVYADPEAFRRYHALANNDPAPVISAWEAGSRTITFLMGRAMPDLAKRFLGAQQRAEGRPPPSLPGKQGAAPARPAL